MNLGRSVYWKQLCSLALGVAIATSCSDIKNTAQTNEQTDEQTEIATATSLLLANSDPQTTLATMKAALSEKASRVIFIAIDSLHPGYLSMNASASGPGQPGDWLMPWTRAFVQASAQWPRAMAHFPQATDMNHLNILASTHTGTNGIVGVMRQPERWGPEEMELGEIHLAKAKYRDGEQVKTLFDLMEEATAGQAVTAFIGNKGWVPEEYGEGFGKSGSVDLVVNGYHCLEGGQPCPFELPPPYYLSFYDNPYTDRDHRCDPETEKQTFLLDLLQKRRPEDHPRDFWIADSALEVMKQRRPDMFYILLADLDHGQHHLGAVNDPAEWVEGPAVKIPESCDLDPNELPLDRYRLVSKRNPALYKEPILDLIRDVDLAFGRLLVGLARGDYLQDAVVVLVSDHNMENYLYREGIEELTNVTEKLEAAGLVTDEKDFFIYGAGSMGLLYWSPTFKAAHPKVVARAKAELLSPAHEAINPETLKRELPWGVMDRQDMALGVDPLEQEPLGIPAGEIYHPYFIEQGVWPDLVVVMRHGWQIPSIAFNIGTSIPWTLNAGHGSPETAAVVTAFLGMGFPQGLQCSEPAHLSDVAATVAHYFGWSLPNAVGRPLRCDPEE